MEEAVQAIFILKTAFNLLFDDSEEDEYDEIEINKKQFQSSKLPEENVMQEQTVSSPLAKADAKIPSLTDTSFKTHFRVNANVFEFICKELYPFMHKKYGPGRNALQLDKQLMITLWYLGNMEALRVVSKRFGVCPSTTWRVILDVCEALHKMNEQRKVIRWPTMKEAAKTADFYYSTYKINGIIGCIDSSHISIRRPSKSANSFLNKTKNHTVVLQAVTNEKMEFLFIYAAESGSLDDATLLAKSDLEAKIDSGDFQISNDQHLIGACSYPLRPWLITPHPCRKSKSLSDKQIYFNTIHYECLDDIKRTFGLLKGRFRRLYHIDAVKIVAITSLIVTCCILHNICLQQQDFPNEDVKIEIEENEKYLYDKKMDSTLPQAVEKRDLLTDLLHNE